MTTNAELVAADPGDEIDFPSIRRQSGRHFLQHQVSDGVSPGIVDLLELVEIEHHQADQIAVVRLPLANAASS